MNSFPLPTTPLERTPRSSFSKKPDVLKCHTALPDQTSMQSTWPRLVPICKLFRKMTPSPSGGTGSLRVEAHLKVPSVVKQSSFPFAVGTITHSLSSVGGETILSPQSYDHATLPLFRSNARSFPGTVPM